MSHTMFDIWDNKEMFEQVAHYILLHVTVLKHIVVVCWCNNKNKTPIIYGFHIHLSDFEKTIFDKIKPSCISLQRACSQVVAVSNISLLFQLKEHKRKAKFRYDSARLKSQFINSIHDASFSTYWIDYPGNIMIELNITKIYDTIA